MYIYIYVCQEMDAEINSKIKVGGFQSTPFESIHLMNKTTTSKLTGQKERQSQQTNVYVYICEYICVT
jgi:hypothetical protein